MGVMISDAGTDRRYVTVSFDGGEQYPCEIALERGLIDVSVSGATKPDPNWTHVDGQGHFHAFADDGSLPTLRRDTLRHDCDMAGDDDHDLDCEGYDTYVSRCLICAAEVQPQQVADYSDRRIPGPTTVTIVAYGAVLDHGRQYSVRVRYPSEDGREAEMFGIANVTGGHYEHGRPSRVTLVCGPLGKRGMARR